MTIWAPEAHILKPNLNWIEQEEEDILDIIRRILQIKRRILDIEEQPPPYQTKRK